ncbi:methyltransferase domain-containing protein [Embleya hyalina]|uniref:Protein-L-isoaspartate O-methyltransferase n=1 Tax=Embleya hyalina TaxID=516124 RepID=A0A401YXC1_9ACTN|nr:methyltransferase domain-containing protein [Embleya hyalina]GCD99248.1 protein-L-isoaspartate O-methyltransferase [Embleya hyalina]
MDSIEARSRLAGEMERRGDWPGRAPWIRDAVEATPRDAFAPDRLWRWDGAGYVAVDRAVDEHAWLSLVYAGPDDAAVTQVVDGVPTSSLSCQAVVVDMLDSLLLEPGHRVLELGTGTGWNAALLARRAGAGNVVSVEVDPDLAEGARKALAAAGVEVRVEVGDGAHGLPAEPAWDRVVSTYAVERVPWAWIAHTRPGGRLVTPWGRLGHVALTVADDGLSASGWVQGLATFMPARGTRAEARFADIRGDALAEDERGATRALAPLCDDPDLLFALRVALPELRIHAARDADGVNAWIHDGHASWAVYSASTGGGTTLYQGGTRRLGDELETAWDRWIAEGGPGLYDHGMTVTPDAQYVWAHHPDTGPRWPTNA